MNITNYVVDDSEIKLFGNKNDLKLRPHTVTITDTNKLLQCIDYVVNQISNELGLKFRKLATNMRLGREGQTMTETAENMIYALGNTASIASTALKAPVMATLRLSSLGIQYAAQLAVQPLHIPVYLFSKIIKIILGIK